MASMLSRAIHRLKRMRIVQMCKHTVFLSDWMLHLCQKVYLERTRSFIASQYLRGEGLEIGAAFSPLDVSRSVKVRYVDHKSREELAREYVDVADRLVHVDVIDSSGELANVPDESADFVIANHVVEHTDNPIHAISQWLRVLRAHGILFMCVPDKRFTFDRQRSVTSVEHLIRDYQDGPAATNMSDVEDYLRCVCNVPDDILAERAQVVLERGLECHYHVWTISDFLALLTYCREELSFPFQIEFCQQHGIEIMIVLRKLGNSEVSTIEQGVF